MHPKFFILFYVVVVVFTTLVSPQVFAKKSTEPRFDEIEFEAPFDLTHPLMTVDLLTLNGKEVVTFSEDKKGNRWIIVYSLNKESALEEKSRVALPKSFYSFDISEYVEGERQTIYFLTDKKLYKFGEKESETKTLTEVLPISSIAVGEQTQYLSKGDFLIDINSDGKEDVYLAGFNATHLFITEAGNFKQVNLPITPRTEFSSQSTQYFKTQLFFTDVNFDSNLDIAYVEKGVLIYFVQSDKGTFDLEPRRLAINEKIHGIDWWDQRGSDGEQLDQSQLSYKRIEQFKDINADSIPDMVVRFTQSEGVLDKTNDYEVYLGQNQNNTLQFTHEPTSIIRGEGTLTGMQFVDVNNDKKSEILVSGFKLGVSQIIGAIIAGSIDQDVHLFYMEDNDTFNKSSKVSKEVELKFSLSSGTSGSPVVKLADIDGNGVKDLILSDDDDRLLLYMGGDNASIFAKRSEKFKTLLPAQGDMLIHDDVNNDGKDDLLLKYGREDNENLRNVFKILLSKTL